MFRQPEMSRSSISKGARADNDRIRGCAEQTHDEPIRRVESADFPAAGFTGNLVTDNSIERADEVANHISSIRIRRESQISRIQSPQVLR